MRSFLAFSCSGNTGSSQLRCYIRTWCNWHPLCLNKNRLTCVKAPLSLYMLSGLLRASLFPYLNASEEVVRALYILYSNVIVRRRCNECSQNNLNPICFIRFGPWFLFLSSWKSSFVYCSLVNRIMDVVVFECYNLLMGIAIAASFYLAI